nr:uncharacterized protein LOC129273080 [Lytechinus pictus]
MRLEKADGKMNEMARGVAAAQELSEDCKKELTAQELTGKKKTRARGKSTKTPAAKKPLKTPSTRGRKKVVKEEITSDHENENESDLTRSKANGRVRNMSKLAELVMSSDDSDAEFQGRTRHSKRDQVLKVLNFADDDSC